MKSASVEYETPAALNTVMNWYRAAFAACGFKLQSSGALWSRRTVVSYGIVWVKPHGRGQYWIASSFAPAAAGGTSILYAAIVYTPPVYPGAHSILRVPGRPVSLTITQYSGLNPGFGALRPLRVVMVTGDSVRNLADEINQLPKLTGGVMSCPADDGSHLTLVFADSNGARRLPLPFTGAGDLRWSADQGRTIGVTRTTPHGTQAWAITLPPIPKDPGHP